MLKIDPCCYYYDLSSKFLPDPQLILITASRLQAIQTPILGVAENITHYWSPGHRSRKDYKAGQFSIHISSLSLNLVYAR